MANTDLLFSLVLIFCHVFAQTPTPTKEGGEFVKGKICIGTNDRMSVPSNRDNHYRNLLERYSNCTYVDGNLELTWLRDENIDLSFLQFIREVTGYVLISHVDVKRIILPRLQIIRGRTLFRVSVQEEEFALMVTMSKMHSLELPSLRDILVGSVGIYNNYNLCHIKTINWDEIITGPGARYTYRYNFTESERECPACNESCEAGCWGEGPENCQKFSKINCSPQCYQGRCFGPNPRECCHLFCAGGCKGPKQSDCLACRNFYDDGVCKQECPAMQKYNPTTYSWETNPEGKYAYGATCVKTCPDHLLKDNGACVRVCPPKKKAMNGECVPCDGPCPKTCQGVSQLNSENIISFKDCTIIEGSLTILDTTFDGYLHIHSDFSFGPRYPKMHPDRLEVFSTLKEITGHLDIQGFHADFKNLSYFRNLEVIGGRTNAEYSSALYIVKTSLESLNLRSLHKISSGAVSILENKNLCFADSINWTRIVRSYQHNTLIRSNQDPGVCQSQGKVCSDQCSTEGCWGPNTDECLSCARYKLVDHCVQSCNQTPGIYEAEPGICKHCHHQCNGTCSGPGPGKCTHCRQVRDGPFCVAECPITKYGSAGECLPCHENCIEGCKGPKNTVGPDGCNSCEKAVINGDVVERCLKKDEHCPDGYYPEYMGPQEQGSRKALAGKPICRRCHPRCKRCIAYGFHVQVCQECARYRRGEQCEDECPREHYADEDSHECLPCHPECRECHGPMPHQCVSCRNYRIYMDGGERDDNNEFNCTAACPAEYPHKILPEEHTDPYCAKEPAVSRMSVGEDDQVAAIIGGVFGCVCLLGIFLALFGYHWRQRARAKENTVKMTMVMSGYEDSEPLRPTNMKPNLAKLRIVKEAELRRGGFLGNGAFGTVHKGVWIPEGENVKIPVAIKVLRERTEANISKEFLEEAYIMASVEHPNLLQLLAVCMTSEMMLVTQLMPLGCLLDYVKNNKNKIGSKPLLNWCTQIAKGMAYLEERRLVHRDLAARNVLVQNPNCVKITDFGLAKLLDIDEDAYKAAGGKMPIKWLALECIQHRVFTHKSDVWAFGVTVWELLTYGKRPYDTVVARDVPDLLEKGERLEQPTIATIEVYMLMVKCWMLDAESRPSFRELADEFAKMARDPARYLCIEWDQLMRLPSYTPQDEKELIRNLSSAMDGPGVLMDAEEYLQPRGSNVPQITNTTTSSSSPPCTPNKDLGMAGLGIPSAPIGGPGAFTSGESPQNMHNWNRERRYAHLEAGRGTPTGSIHTHDGSSRYCSDPLKMVGRDTSDESYDPALKREAMVGGLKLDLPLDDDDYLMPSPQQVPSNSSAYMDLIGDSKSADADFRNGGTFGSYPDFLPINANRSATIMDNPEYHIMNQGSGGGRQSQPHPPHPQHQQHQPQVHFHNLHPQHHLQPPQHHPQQLTPQRSSEEESDHEYYNDLDRLQRELQPLKPAGGVSVSGAGGTGAGVGLAPVAGAGVGAGSGGRRSETTV